MAAAARMPGLSGFRSLSPRAKLWTGALILAFAMFNVAILVKAALVGAWIRDLDGLVLPADFVSFWSTSRMLQSGPAAQVYDWARHLAAEAEVLGRTVDLRFPWLNPPIFLLAVAPLAFLPYTTAFTVWLLVTFAAYLASLRAILPDIPGWGLAVGACAFPATLWTAYAGQNGFLTAALVGGSLALMDRRPILAGVLLGLLTCKPQFGILFPFVLLAAGRWKVLLAAGGTASALAIATTAFFGPETWLAFWNSLPLTQQAVLAEGQMGTYKLQSVYGAILWMTGNPTAAWTGHVATAGILMAGLTFIWRSRTAPELKAAALGVGTVLATPYVMIYDLTILTIPIAFVLRAGLARGFLAAEIPLILSSAALVFSFPIVKAPIGLAASCLIALLVLQRTLAEARMRHQTTAAGALA